MEWDYGSNERIDDWDKIDILKELQRVATIPYEQRAEIITPVLNKLVTNKIEPKNLIESYNKEKERIEITYGEI